MTTTDFDFTSCPFKVTIEFKKKGDKYPVFEEFNGTRENLEAAVADARRRGGKPGRIVPNPKFKPAQ